MAASLVPSADDAIPFQVRFGALLDCHVAPKLVEAKIPPLLMTATTLLPSAEQAMACQLLVGAPVWVHVCAATGRTDVSNRISAA